MAGVGEAAEGMIRGRLTPALPEALKAYKQGFTQKDWDMVDVKGKPLYYEHDETKKIGEITNKWSEGGWLGIDAKIYKDKPEVKPYYDEIIQGKASALSIGFWSDPADVYQPIKWKRFQEASVTKDPADPRARIFVARNKDGAAGTGGANHSITMPFSVVKPGESLPTPPPQQAESSSGQDQLKQLEQQEQKTGATSTEAPKSVSPVAPVVVEAPSTASVAAKVSSDAQPTVTTLSTSPNTTTSAPPPASPIVQQPPSNNNNMADAAASSSSAPAQPAPAAQQPPASAPQQNQGAPKTQHTLTNNSSNQSTGQEQTKTKSEEAPATEEQKNLFRDLQKLLKEKASKQAEKDAAKAKDAAAEKKPETPAPAQKEEKPKAAQQPPAKKQQQPPADEEMHDQDDAEEAEEEEQEQKPKKKGSASEQQKISQKHMDKMIEELTKRVEYFEKKEKEAEARRQAELEAEYDQNFNTFVEADKELKLIPDGIKDKAHEQIRAIFHTPEYAEAQQVIGTMLAKLASVQEQKPAEEDSGKGKKRGRTEEKAAESKKVGKTAQKKAPIAQDADEDDDDEDVASVAGFKVPKEAMPDILSKKLAKSAPRTTSSMMKQHAEAYGRAAPPVLVQRNATKASSSSSSTVFSQFGDSNSRKAFEFLTQATSGYDPAKHKAMREDFEKKQRLRAEGINI